MSALHSASNWGWEGDATETCKILKIASGEQKMERTQASQSSVPSVDAQHPGHSSMSKPDKNVYHL
jgi:hypothetical protein